MSLIPHVVYPGQCEEAFTFYARLFGGKLWTISHRDTPRAGEVPAEWRDKLVHATLSFDGCELAGADVQPAQYRRPQGFFVLLDVEGVDDAHRIFGALAEGGRVEMPMQKTFWSPAYGVLVDRFGIPWEINGKSAEPSI